ncbi:ATPase [Podospora didyma]|uniref:ATPase n=1 Tax=Podospora didyma TaxID=330526 RepID=A0AAE0P6T3_9PEZI|nr:ATPase [Podospora didyma]
MELYGTDDFNNETSSTASFEDVGLRPRVDNASSLFNDLTAKVPGKRALLDEDMPDIVFTVQYCNGAGRVIETRRGGEPLDILTVDANEGKSAKKKPIIEIVTRVSPPYRHSGAPPGAPRQYEFDSFQEGTGYEAKLYRTERIEMLIHSRYLKAALEAIVCYYPSGIGFNEDQMAIEAPYRVLVHHWKALELYRTDQPSSHDTECKEITSNHIDVLLSFLKRTYAEQLTVESARWNNPLGGTTSFDLFWVLLKPGEIVYQDEDGQMVPFVISSVSSAGLNGSDPSSYLVNFWNVKLLNNRLQRHMNTRYIYSWKGERAIGALPLVPARFLPGGANSMAEKQVKLGKLYWELAKQPAYREYDGTLVNKDGNRGGNMTGRVIVDCEGWERYGDGAHGKMGSQPPGPPRPGPQHPRKDSLPQVQPRCSCKACRESGLGQAPSPFARFDNLDPKTDNPPENGELYYHVLDKTIPAFILGERRWALLKVEFLKDVRPDKDAFKYLVLDSEVKLTVKALIGKLATSNGKVSPWPSDFVKNKGEGRIFLLHGSPGVGKTCTAECVAELTHRPLLALTSGDISTSMSAASVERSLNYFLGLGERFGALILLDEADVYLEERRVRDLRRNGLVSIFLRALEYYRGVLFLTTNRVEAFDSAFTSRIHVALHYRRLSDDDRQRIWMHNFERLERDSAGKCYIPQNAREFAFASAEVRALRWNGREIRNALQTAVALAETEAMDDGVETVTVTDKHIRSVAKMSSGFKEYLRRKRITKRVAGQMQGHHDKEEQDGDGVDDSNDDEDSVCLSETE